MDLSSKKSALRVASTSKEAQEMNFDLNNEQSLQNQAESEEKAPNTNPRGHSLKYNKRTIHNHAFTTRINDII